MYAKLFKQTYYGSMMGAGAHVHAVWPYALAHASPDGLVELNPPLVAFQIGMPVEDVVRAIEYLTAPDPNSRSSAEEGRRLIHLGGFLYRIANLPEYRKIRDDLARREYNRVKQAERRQRLTLMSKHVNTSTDVSPRMSAQAEAEAEAEADLSKRHIRANKPEPDPSNKPERPKIDPHEVAQAFNEILGTTLPRVSRLTQQRITQIRARANDFFPTIEAWKEYFNTVASSPFLLGDNKNGWQANFDWLIQPRNAAKVLEGVYKGTRRGQTQEVNTLPPLSIEEA